MSDVLPVLEAKNLYHVYESRAEDGNVVALRGLHITIEPGEAVAVIGPSGSGKSTLLKCLGGLMKPSSGSVSLYGRNMTRLSGLELVELRQQTVSFIFQESNLLPHLSALDNVAQPLVNQGIPSSKARPKAMEQLERLGIAHRAAAIPALLSGGEQQRVAIGRALITNPKLILADEPTGALDPITSREVLDLFRTLHADSEVAFLIVTHSKETAAFADRSLELRQGRFVAQHGMDLDIEDLSKNRELLIDELGVLNLTPDLLLEIGGSGRYMVEEASSGRLVLVSTDQEASMLGGQLVLASACPACNHAYGASKAQECPECGSSRPMVEA